MVYFSPAKTKLAHDKQFASRPGLQHIKAKVLSREFIRTNQEPHNVSHLLSPSQLEYCKIPNLRESRDRSPQAKKKEVRWDNRCYRISVMNEIVHRHYRTLFEDIASKKKL
jgi:hypothetical protein